MPTNNYNWTDLNSIDGSYSIFENAMRKAIDYDANTSDLFEARVLTIPTTVTKKPRSATVGDAPAQQTTYAFMVRILGDKSPHKFLEDPCLVEDADDPNSRIKIFNLIQMHTKVFLQDNSQQPLPNIADIVQIRLEKGTTGGFKSDEGQFISKIFSAQPAAKKKRECSTAISSFNLSDFATFDSLSSGEERMNKKYVSTDSSEIQDYLDYWNANSNFALEEDECGVRGAAEEIKVHEVFELAKCKTGTIGGKQVTLHPEFFEIVEAAYRYVLEHRTKDESKQEPFYPGSDKRSPSQQLRIRLGNRIDGSKDKEIIVFESSKKGGFDPPTAALPKTSWRQGSNHLYGLAIDFGGILGTLNKGNRRSSETYKLLEEFSKKPENKDKFKNWDKEPWHWSHNGH